MSIDTKRGVPGVPLAALDAIQDENTRQVLQSIIAGWHVRNGVSGSGDNRFVTAAELGQLSGQVGGLGKAVASIQNYPESQMSSSQINRIINSLQASVMESVLFKELGDRITLINRDLLDKLTAEAIARQAAITEEQTIRQTSDTSLASQITTITAAVDTNAAAIQTEQTARANADNAITSNVTTQLSTVNGNLSALQTQLNTQSNNVSALSQSITTLQATVGQNTTAIQNEATARVNADGDIYSKYSVKIDTNGYVTGFGLISTANNSTPYSEFIVRADRFAIGSPEGSGITPTVPFIVTTTPTTLADGTEIPAGTYIDYAMVKRLEGAFIYAGLLQASKIYTGSQYVDINSKQDIPAVAVGSWRTDSVWGRDVVTDSGLRFYGPAHHSYVPYYQRVKQTSTDRQVGFVVTVSATIDHNFSLWYRYNSGNWIHLYTVVEPQNSYGSAGIALDLLLDIGYYDYVDFGVRAADASGWTYDYNKQYLYSLSVNAIGVNL